MLVTVAICTRNRAASLARTLECLIDMAPPDVPWEVLVIDNGSTDNTPQVLAGFVGRLPLRWETEARAGISHARNRAAAAAQGAYIAWTDDDTLVDREWLATYARAFARWPEATLFGGRIEPVLLPPQTRLFRDHFGLLTLPLGARDLGPETRPLDAREVPFGANFAVRTAEQRRFPFDAGLGKGPSQLRLAEETAVCEAMLRAGCSGWWLPDSRVRHLVPPEQQTLAHVRRYYVAAGETEAYRYGAPGPRIFGVPRWLWRRLLQRSASYHLTRQTAPASVWLPHLIALAQAEGAVAYWRRAARAG
jgi:hypothetical protein